MEMKTYADKINQQFTEEASNPDSLQQRPNDALELNPVFAKMLDGAVDESNVETNNGNHLMI